MFNQAAQRAAAVLLHLFQKRIFRVIFYHAQAAHQPFGRHPAVLWAQHLHAQQHPAWHCGAHCNGLPGPGQQAAGQGKGVFAVLPAMAGQKAFRGLLQIAKLKNRGDKMHILLRDQAAGKALEQMAPHACQVKQVSGRSEKQKVNALAAHGGACARKAVFIQCHHVLLFWHTSSVTYAVS